jgi:hypothetical protein
MRPKRILIMLICLLMGLWSCEKELDTSFVVSEKQLVIQGFICPQDTLIQVAISINKVLGETQTNAYRPLNDAKVMLTEGSNKSAILNLMKPNKIDSLNNWSRYGVSAKKFSIESGKTYKITVSYNNLPDARAECTIPSKQIDEKNVVLDIKTELYNGENYKTFNVSWKDFDDTQNYYSWNVISNLNFDQDGKSVWNGYRYSTYYQSDAYHNGMMLSGENRNSIIGSNRKYTNKSYIEIYLCHTDKTYYDYNISIIRQQQNKGSAFPEPIALRGNIEGGLGVFAGYNLTKIRQPL